MHRDQKETVDELFEENLEVLRDEYDADSIKLWHDWFVKNRLGDDDARSTREWKDQLQKLELVLMND